MSVKTIFKTLIGTVVVIVMISLCIELFNVNVSGLQIKTVSSIATKQAAELFTQETYRPVGDVYADTEAMAANMKDIKAADGTVYISGNFYGNSTTVHGIWNSLYGPSNTTFKNVCTMTAGGSPVSTTINVGGSHKVVNYSLDDLHGDVKTGDIKVGDRYIHLKYPWGTYAGSGDGGTKTPVSIYKELGQLYAGIHDTTNVDIASMTTITFDDYRNNRAVVRNKSYAVNARQMRSKYFTPVNVGFPYFDAEVVNKIFQWDLAMILSNGSSNSIVQDETGKYYINYKGFRCYVQDAYISELEYHIIDTKTDAGTLRELTNLDASRLRDVDVSASGTDTLDNRYVTVVSLKYNIPIAYQGISPLKKIFEYTWNNEVNGLEGNHMNSMGTDRTGMTGTGQYDLSAQAMSNDNAADNGALTTFGVVNYVLVR